ncbi:MAG: translation initiation factor IF-2 [Clostridia bacterium]
MGKIKIYDIAKKLNLTSKEVLEVAKKLNINVKSHLSGIEEEEAKRIEDDINKKENKKQEKEIVKKEKIGTKKEEKAPVIIRREVIISQEAEQTKKKEPVKKENKKNNVGFVERKQNKDYNIVYRNKPSKPMTVSELFGLKKEEPKKEEKVKVEQENKKEEMKKEDVKEVKKEETLKKVALDSKPQKQERENKTIGRENKMNRENRDNRQNRNNYSQNSNNYNNNNRNNNRFNHNNNRFNNNNNSNNNGRFNGNNNNNGNNRFNNRNNNDRFNKRPLDEKGIEKNIKNIMSVETVEKESVREYNRGIDKQKNNNKFEENKGKKSKSRRNNSAGDFDEGKLKSLKQANRLSNMFDEQDGGMLDYYDLTTERGRRGKKRKNQNQEERTKQKIFQLTEIEIPETVTVKDLAADMKKTTAEVIKKLLGYGIMATINQEIDFDTAYLIAQEFGITATKKETVTEEDILFDDSEDKEEELETRPPVIVVMGHVDHGKTSLLDAVRKTNVIEGEAGGITQAIGAYKVKVKDREITFLDTPGHEAFTAMRARGAQITDIAILVVAANDGVKPQTIEAINHAKSAGIPIIVAINKIDLPDANIEKVKQELMAYELVPEEWGGDTIYVPISAKKGENIDQLLEMVLLEADVLELKANPHKQAKGAVIEARLDKSKGAIATMLVQRGTLDVGDTIVVGSSIGRIRAMKDDKGKSVKAAGPSTPVEIMGLTEVPEAGDTFYEVKNEKMAKHLIERRKRQAREKAINSATKVTLDNLFTQMEQGNLKVLNLIVKADVQGSVEAVKQAMEKLENEEVKVKVIHAAAGAVNQSDVTLAKVSNAIIIAFNVRPDNMAKEMAEKDEVEIKQYSIIYQAIEDVEAAMKGMLDPKYEEKVIGNAEVRQTFKISNVGTIAGCYVISGKVERNAGVRVIRENVVIHDGHLATLKRFKDDVKEVTKGFECGIQIENYNDIKEGDVIEVYIMEEIKR